ncbi:MAG: DUF4956 domain-containing protein [Lachnospiraceae bacterium]|nr:DUF4956 domain-containing protein [Lachnospiraceae bacterium]
MGIVTAIMNNIQNSFGNAEITTSVILTVLLMTLAMSIFEFLVYLAVSRRSFYNRSFHISLTILPFFISMIILCLQSNIVITLGTIGALAIIRYRTAVRDPIDMLYILWSVFIGITCGCRLYEVCILTSVFVTLILIVLENLGTAKRPFIIVFDCAPEKEEAVLASLNSGLKRLEIKSRSFAGGEMHDTVEAVPKDADRLTALLKELEITRFSVISYDAENII